VETEVRNGVRNAEVALKQLEIAREGRALTEQQLDIEREKLRLGRSTNFQVVNFQNDLVDSETAELAAAFSYFNALTYLDQTLGPRSKPGGSWSVPRTRRRPCPRCPSPFLRRCSACGHAARGHAEVAVLLQSLIEVPLGGRCPR